MITMKIGAMITMFCRISANELKEKCNQFVESKIRLSEGKSAMLSPHRNNSVITPHRGINMKIPKHKAFRLLLSGNNTIIGAAPMKPTPLEREEFSSNEENPNEETSSEKDLHPKDAEPRFPTNTSVGYYIAAILARPTTLEAWTKAVHDSDTWFEASWRMVQEYGGIQLNPDPVQIKKKRNEERIRKINVLQALSHLNKGEA